MFNFKQIQITVSQRAASGHSNVQYNTIHSFIHQTNKPKRFKKKEGKRSHEFFPLECHLLLSSGCEPSIYDDAFPSLIELSLMLRMSVYIFMAALENSVIESNTLPNAV